jgi:hypothetical protein
VLELLLVGPLILLLLEDWPIIDEDDGEVDRLPVVALMLLLPLLLLVLSIIPLLLSDGDEVDDNDNDWPFSLVVPPLLVDDEVDVSLNWSRVDEYDGVTARPLDSPLLLPMASFVPVLMLPPALLLLMLMISKDELDDLSTPLGDNDNDNDDIILLLLLPLALLLDDAVLLLLLL